MGCRLKIVSSHMKKSIVEGRGFILFDILAVNTAEAERFRLDDGTPYLKFSSGSAATAIATLEVTSDF